MKKKIIIITSIIIGLIVIVLCGFLIYVNDYYHANEMAIEALESTDKVEVIKNDNLYIFSPEDANTGIIFYPGAKVEYKSYAPLMVELASKYNIFCVIVEMPFNLAVLGVNLADGIIEEFSHIDSWYMAGHSLGGAMAASYISKKASSFDGLILLAAYSTSNLCDTNLIVLSIYGENDNVLNRNKYDSNLSNLPINYKEQIIEGGNHAYFGSYGKQSGDGEASISNLKQIELTAKYIYEFIQK